MLREPWASQDEKCAAVWHSDSNSAEEFDVKLGSESKRLFLVKK